MGAPFLGRLLATTDGFGDGERAVTFAIGLAVRYRSTLQICYAVDGGHGLAECCSTSAADGLTNAAKLILLEARTRAQFAGVSTDSTMLDGLSVEDIVACKSGHPFDAVILSTHGRSWAKHLVAGSMAEGLLPRSSLPTFVVPHGATQTIWPAKRIIVAVDGSIASDAAIAFAIRFATNERAKLVFYAGAHMYAIGNGASHTLVIAAELARRAGVGSESVAYDGDPADRTIENSAALRADLIIIGTDGVSASIVRRSSVPVAVIRGVAVGSRAL